MIETVITSFKLKNAYRVNGIIYLLKRTPFIKRLLPSSLYANQKLKIFANVLSILGEILTLFIWKFLYFPLMILAPIGLISSLLDISIETADAFTHVFFFLTAIGGFLNTDLFAPSRDKYYAIFLMRMDARNYTLCNYYYFLIRCFVGFIPASVIFGTVVNNGILFSLLFPILVVEMKLIFGAFILNGNARNENNAFSDRFTTVSVLCLLGLAYIPLFFGLSMSRQVFAIIIAVLVIPAFFAFNKIRRYDKYRAFCKKLLSPSALADPKEMQTEMVQKSSFNQIDAGVVSGKGSGYEYFNDLFVKRHRKLLMRSSKRITYVCLAVFAACSAACLLLPEFRADLNREIPLLLPCFPIFMYFINRGKAVTQAMFMNCDHSMLSYRFFRKPKAILSLFRYRLLSLIVINLPPATVIAFGLMFLLYLSGGTDNFWNYPLTAVSILSMSVFFSVHHLVLYYLLQPYRADLELKSPAYGIINYVTYFACYYICGKDIPTIFFGSIVSAFCIIYVLIALLLAYKLAPKTFKLHN